jgi:hypothetical protein
MRGKNPYVLAALLIKSGTGVQGTATVINGRGYPLFTFIVGCVIITYVQGNGRIFREIG